jgi:hypothetical protein
MDRKLDYKLRKALTDSGRGELFLELKASLAKKRGPKPKFKEGCFLIVRVNTLDKESLKEKAREKGVNLSDLIRSRVLLTEKA